MTRPLYALGYGVGWVLGALILAGVAAVEVVEARRR